MPDQLTGERAFELLREVVAERPDYVYDSPDPDVCLYVHTDADGGLVCGCLVGHVLHRHGIALEQLLEVNARLAATLPADWMDADAREALRFAQLAQDAGNSWSQALSCAEQRAAEPAART